MVARYFGLPATAVPVLDQLPDPDPLVYTMVRLEFVKCGTEPARLRNGNSWNSAGMRYRREVSRVG